MTGHDWIGLAAFIVGNFASMSLAIWWTRRRWRRDV